MENFDLCTLDSCSASNSSTVIGENIVQRFLSTQHSIEQYSCIFWKRFMSKPSGNDCHLIDIDGGDNIPLLHESQIVSLCRVDI